MDGLTMPRELVAIPGPVDAKIQWPVPRQVYEFQVTFMDSTFTESIRQRQLLQEVDGEGGHKEVRAGIATEQATVLYEYRREVTQGDRSVCTRRALSSEAYHLLKSRTADDSVEVRKSATCFEWADSHYELCSYL